jgi:acyl-CoA synthetase (AMP-forming)/AMP-acid ligase II
MNLATLLEMAATSMPDSVLVSSGDDHLTGDELIEHAGKAAGVLRAAGAAKLAYLGLSDVSMPVALLGSAWAGVPFMPLNYRQPMDSLVALLRKHPGTFVVAEDETARGLAAAGIPSEVPDTWWRDGEVPERWEDDPDEIAVLLHTSGTTSAPKAVVLRHRHLTSYIMNATELLASMGETVLVAVPPYHVAGVANLLTNLYAGRRLVYLPSFTAREWLDIAAKEGVTRAMVVPTMLARIVDELDAADELAPASLESISYGGARMPRPVLERALRRFPEVGFVNAYGLTETSSTIAVLGPEDHAGARVGDAVALRRLDSVGQVVPDVEVQVIDDTGRPLPNGEVGEIRVRGAQVSGEYLGDESPLDPDGWFATRDLGWLDDDGYLFVQGRGDDTIIRGGENIVPDEIEEAIERHPLVTEVCVVGVPDDEWGESIVAVVVTKEAVDPDELRQFAKSQLRTAKTPDRIEFRDELPRTPLGKLQRGIVRRELRP